MKSKYALQTSSFYSFFSPKAAEKCIHKTKNTGGISGHRYGAMSLYFSLGLHDMIKISYCDYSAEIAICDTISGNHFSIAIFIFAEKRTLLKS